MEIGPDTESARYSPLIRGATWCLKCALTSCSDAHLVSKLQSGVECRRLVLGKLSYNFSYTILNE